MAFDGPTPLPPSACKILKTLTNSRKSMTLRELPVKFRFHWTYAEQIATSPTPMANLPLLQWALCPHVGAWAKPAQPISLAPNSGLSSYESNRPIRKALR